MSDYLFYTSFGQETFVEIPKIKWSKFLAYGQRVVHRDEALAYLQSIRDLHPQATHHCYAYRVWVRSDTSLFWEVSLDHEYIFASDDWEPWGSAAYPIKNTIVWHNVHNCIVVVVRYYGGVNLGIGWLVQAYGDATKSCLLPKYLVQVPLQTNVYVICTYDQISIVMHVASLYKAHIVSQRCDIETTIFLSLNSWVVNDFVSACWEQQILVHFSNE